MGKIIFAKKCWLFFFFIEIIFYVYQSISKKWKFLKKIGNLYSLPTLYLGMAHNQSQPWNVGEVMHSFPHKKYVPGMTDSPSLLATCESGRSLGS